MVAFSKFSVVINASDTSQMLSIYPIYIYIYIYIFIYLFIYIMKLSRISDSIAASDRLLSELSIEKNVERSIHDLI